MQISRYTRFIYVALPCEAKPLIDYFSLKKQMSITVFAVYSSDTICLTVTGIGKSAMTAAIAYTQALFTSTTPNIFINIGIAGHKYYDLGKLVLINKINDSDTGKNYYPPLIFNANVCSAPLQTVSKPAYNYHDHYLCDMEASAFYETANRFSYGELTQCLKVISDNSLSPVTHINAKQVTELIAVHLPTIEYILTKLTDLALQIEPIELPLLPDLIERYHFTRSEQLRLTACLSRWYVLTNNQTIDTTDIPQHCGKDVLRWLHKKVATIPLNL